ncbi:MAG: TlpA family protein disulfide reductase [Muribaculaceae bacterium]|nr:TlpA family protein disulfide reductase [Muribaculaceae bacterium]
MKKTTKTYLLLFILALLAYVALLPVRGYDLKIAAGLQCATFFALTFWALWKYNSRLNPWAIVFMIVLPWLADIGFRIYTPETTMRTLPLTALPLQAILAAVIIYYNRKIWLVLLLAAALLYSVTEGQNQWYEWASYGHKQAKHTSLATAEIFNGEQAVSLGDINEDYLVLDVWSSTCGACINAMPDVQALHDKYKDSKKVEVASLFVCYKEETIDTALEIVKKRGCNLPVYAVDRSSVILSECGITAYPHVLILDENRNVIFNGSLIFAMRILKSLNL